MSKQPVSTEESDALSTVWQEVREWPANERQALASKIVQSLQAETLLEETEPVRLSDLIGAWKTQPVPTDDEIERILEEERIRKYT